MSGRMVGEVTAALVDTLPYVLDAARRAERLGLDEESVAAWATYRRARWLVRAVQDGGQAPLLKRPIEYED